MTRRLPFLLLLLMFVASSTAKEIPGFWSLHCGGEGFEAKNNITWISDKAFVRTGIIRQGNNGSLRAFTSKKYKKNCYAIPVGKGVKILVRLTFSYGNYDGFGSPPDMELIFDGYDWGPLQTTMEGGDRMEVIYVTKRKNTNICLGRTASNGDPFISLIEVRTLELNMYNRVDGGKVLRRPRRDAFGADGVIRYPDDRYDRWWFPRSEGFTVLRSDTNYTNTTSWPVDDPPSLLIRTAVGPLNMTSSTLSISLPNLPTYPVPIYYIIYFSEMSSNKTTHGSRAFDNFVGGSKMSSEPIIPPYQSVDGYSNIYGVEATNSTTFEFVSTQNATLPPIISGMEIFVIEDADGATSENDVVALGNLQERFEILQEWTGDPCLPEKFNWEWVGCQLLDNPRVSKLDLSGFGLSGKLPDFTDLDQLVVIDLHNNSLNGPIPEFFNNFRDLTVLNLADNKFTSIPDSLLHNKKIKLNISGNPISLPPPGGKDGSQTTATKSEGRKAKVPDQLLLSLVILLLVILF